MYIYWLTSTQTTIYRHLQEVLKVLPFLRIRSEFSDHLAKFYKQPVLCSSSYYVASTGVAPIEKVKEYITSVRIPHKANCRTPYLRPTAILPHLVRRWGLPRFVQILSSYLKSKTRLVQTTQYIICHINQGLPRFTRRQIC